ncbi:c-type cytochrome [Acidipila rosea]|uniref:Cytochrome c oxidase cbb3-type subunit 3 n=1 Tax=Acidipila rosea TaxID=768535 RepID=A0A4R1L7N6_9BACT|nr:c-type cytochrome [Acidipila rosea]MBW4027259.1 c-type cytochrome [Acidobacteriota bacterium]MBW4046153.1 c-type cytochrome [Acidobacteriota bacterium]TCK74235.1 cytochrome c oxidase cbb3-type subunit 3 [Acidipila rosea]
MHARMIKGGVALLSALTLAGCTKPKERVEPVQLRPEQVVSFPTLYAENCAACHGAHGRDGIALALNNPVYLAVADDATLKNVISNGEEGALMPAFAKSAGGFLTDQQVGILASGIRQQWGQPGVLDGQNPPPYKSDKQADAANGQKVYATYCASCHGADSAHAGKAGSILDGSFLALVNGQTLRTIILAGRPDLGQPDWRNDVPGHPMTDQEITDVVAWLESQQPKNPGQPYLQGQQP